MRFSDAVDSPSEVIADDVENVAFVSLAQPEKRPGWNRCGGAKVTTKLMRRAVRPVGAELQRAAADLVAQGALEQIVVDEGAGSWPLLPLPFGILLRQGFPRYAFRRLLSFPSLAVAVEQVLADIAKGLTQVSTCLGDAVQGFLDCVCTTDVDLEVYARHRSSPRLISCLGSSLYQNTQS